MRCLHCKHDLSENDIKIMELIHSMETEPEIYELPELVPLVEHLAKLLGVKNEPSNS